MGIFLRNYFAFVPVLFGVTFVSFQFVEIPILQVSLAIIYSYIMILNSNMIFWTPILEYLKIFSLPSSNYPFLN